MIMQNEGRRAVALQVPIPIMQKVDVYVRGICSCYGIRRKEAPRISLSDKPAMKFQGPIVASIGRPGGGQNNIPAEIVSAY